MRSAGQEWVKLRGPRSTWWMLAIAVVAMIGVAILVLRYFPGHWAAGR